MSIMDSGLTPKQDKFCREYLIDLNATQAAIRAGYFFSETNIGFYVYLLMNTVSGKIIYVGKGKGNRMHGHLKEFQRGRVSNAKKSFEIRSSYSSGAEIKPIVFCDNLSEREAFGIERNLICELKDCGITNIQSGVMTNEDLQKERAIQMLNKVIPFEVWKKSIKPSEYHIELYHKIVHNLKLIANA